MDEITRREALKIAAAGLAGASIVGTDLVLPPAESDFKKAVLTYARAQARGFWDDNYDSPDLEEPLQLGDYGGQWIVEAALVGWGFAILEHFRDHVDRRLFEQEIEDYRRQIGEMYWLKEASPDCRLKEYIEEIIAVGHQNGKEAVAQSKKLGIEPAARRTGWLVYLVVPQRC